MNRYDPAVALPPLSPEYDPWDPIRSLRRYGRHVLTSVEFTVTNLCNMRCEHCAVGDALTMTEGARVPLADVLRRLDEVEHLETISITGGEPSYRESTVKDYVVPLLKYARERGVRTQINSNVTLDLSRYEMMAPYLDVMHISFNYTGADDFHRVGFVHAGHPVGRETAVKMYERMMDNASALSKGGMFVSAESMINFRTHEHIADIHRLIVEMGCKRHEVHPMYPSAFAAGLPQLSLDQIRGAVTRLLDERDRDLWMLFGTLPFFACGDDPDGLELVRRLRREPNVTVRNDPDGRNRLNVNLFNGDVHVTDFADLPPLGNMERDSFDAIFAKWLDHPLNLRVNCHCDEAACCGPNLLVADAYYRDVDFKSRRATV
ncbi:radical SAM/CxCxxxxC motif protein YfkAB [Paenibacillus flagellatus]|uniref:Radical SAM/CxCxxxxC motif protein YfkAB n=1 Tax=Paenibacillus flagellatus TaxID=2211139 RepID=A0A2V5KC52_9BACL|nr:radical SAM/CxCxxxxC motif protein YfkAB [Paenibacillus flagellatus]PYI57169.1 radical SAM/CxCxxxxC motif protein YfkAB [Paenibacillus flagellatus]